MARKQWEVRTAFLQASGGGGGRWLHRKKPGAPSASPEARAPATRRPGDHNAPAPLLYCRRPFFQDRTISPGSGGGGVSDLSPSSPPCPARLHAIRPGPARPSPSALTAPTAPAAPPLPRLLPHPLPAVAAPPDPSRAGPGGSEHVGPLRPEPEAGLRPASSRRRSPSRRREVWSLSALCAGGGSERPCGPSAESLGPDRFRPQAPPAPPGLQFKRRPISPFLISALILESVPLLVFLDCPRSRVAKRAVWGLALAFMSSCGASGKPLYPSKVQCSSSKMGVIIPLL